VIQDRALQLAQRLARLDPQLANERPAPVLVDLERLRLPPDAVKGEHQLGAQALAQRMLSDEPVELGHEIQVAPECQLGADPVLERRDAKLLETPCVRL
jgi:hypothetical protein